MNEFKLLIRNRINHHSEQSPEHHFAFVKACELYIEKLRADGHLIAAQPLVRTGKMLAGTPENWKIEPFHDEHEEVIVGYYHLRAADLDEAIELAKGNPEFSFSQTARIEIRPIKMAEPTTNFIYPKKED